MAAFDPNLIEQIRDACEHFDRRRAGELVEQLARDIRGTNLAYPSTQAHGALKALRRKRYFDLALDLADAVIESGQRDPLVRVSYAQALIDTECLAAAVPFIESLIASTTPDSHAHNEAQGLLGRAYKQLYVNAGGEKWLRADYLVRAFNAYYDAWAENSELTWHGINAAALRFCAERDQIDLPPVQPFLQTIYGRLREKIESGSADEWTYVTAGEAALALRDYELAKRWYATYVAGDPKRIDAFEIASSLRQLIEVWQLDEDESPGKEILPLLRAALLSRDGGVLRIDPGSVVRGMQAAQQAGLEKTFGHEGVKTLKWYETGLQRCRPICRVERLDEHPHGTGFLVRGADFHPALGDELFVLTNYHVLSYDHPIAIPPEKALVRFEALSRTKTYRLDPKIVWGDRECDASLVRFAGKPPANVEVFPIAGKWPVRQKNQPPPVPRVYVTGHPLGGPMSISMYDNELLACDGKRLHYRAPTEPGSSGSPVFNDQWELIGLHHFGDHGVKSLYGDGEIYDANEAYWIGTVIEKCKAALTPPAPPLPPRSSRPSTRGGKASRRRT